MFNLGAEETPPKVDRVPHIPFLEVNNVKQGYFEEIMFDEFCKRLPDYLKGFVSFGMRTGRRLNEIIGVRWKQVENEVQNPNPLSESFLTLFLLSQITSTKKAQFNKK